MVAREGVGNGTGKIQHKIEVVLGNRFGNNLIITVCCNLSANFFSFLPVALSYTYSEPDDSAKYCIM